jgi:hypothetical protein
MSTNRVCPPLTIPLRNLFTNEVEMCQGPNSIIEPTDVEVPGTAEDNYVPAPPEGNQ